MTLESKAMFSFKQKKNKTRVYLGAIVVIPRNEWRKIDERGIFKNESFEDHIRTKLEELFSFARIPDDLIATDNDIAIELTVTKICGGEFSSFNINIFAIPIIWRPKVQITARTYKIKSNKTIQSYKIIKPHRGVNLYQEH